MFPSDRAKWDGSHMVAFPLHKQTDKINVGTNVKLWHAMHLFQKPYNYISYNF